MKNNSAISLIEASSSYASLTPPAVESGSDTFYDTSVVPKTQTKTQTLRSALEEWMKSMPIPPLFAFNPYERLHGNLSSKLYFCRLEENGASTIDDQKFNVENWISQKETLFQDFKDIRRSLLARKNKKFKY